MLDRTVPKVGKYYRVNCAIWQFRGEDTFVPIIGKHHTDPQFGNEIDHYHVDGRFIKKSIGHIIIDEKGHTNNIIDIHSERFKGITVKIRKCVRSTTGINPPNWGDAAHEYKKWYKGYVGRTCTHKVCPHRGAIMQERDGILVCPLHGLKASKETETIIPL